MDPPACKEKPRVKEPVSRGEKAKQKSAQQDWNRQRAEVCALNSNNKTGVPGEKLGGFCEQMQPPGE
ncbi:small vasohibin-binding protein-like [Bubalus kerabau]|uniref:small vasohibin-binding protein-like n=1 Tax=Bubalus carabanensis TaxID=3119969 RepID=UPI00244EA7BC|nr:small vasohibin-binding protein-like [Bubalus carabanensis]